VNKVDELVEWVARVIYEEPQAISYFNWETAQERDKQYYRRKAKQILSHPDLALIDRENDLPEVAYHSSNWCLIPRRFIKSHIEAVIPLAGAIKGVVG